MTNLFWFRRDLRLEDNHGLSQALSNGTTLCCFIFDKIILDGLAKDDKRIGFITESLVQIKKTLNQYNSDLLIIYGDPEQLIPQIVFQFKIDQVYANEDYEPYAIKRDQQLATLVKLNLFKDQVIFAKKELTTLQNKPYIKFTAYKKAWLKRLSPAHYQTYLTNNQLNNLHKTSNLEFFHPESLGFSSKSIIPAGVKGASRRLNDFIGNLEIYHETRNFPAKDSHSGLSVDLRFGTVSVRNLVQLALANFNKGSEVWLNELIWREFFSQILYNFPHVVDSAFKPKYAQIKYQNDQYLFERWCYGQTGYPIIDAGMRQLNETGFMHNRLRLITASFLVKDLLIDWRWGEIYFGKKLLDYELSSNNGNWQWCASTGCDSQPYFRIFNPSCQVERFDPEAEYITKYLPELIGKDKHLIKNPSEENNKLLNYYTPIVNHQQASIRARQIYAHATKKP